MLATFPPSPPLTFSPSDLVVLGVLFGLALLALGGLFWVRRRLPLQSEAVGWFGVAGISTIGACSGLEQSDHLAAWVIGLMLINWMLAANGLVLLLARNARYGQGVSLQWLLKRLGISSILLGVILYWATQGVNEAREAAHRLQCRGNLKVLGLAFHNWHDAHDKLPEARFADPPMSWRVEILPYIDQQRLHDDYDPTKPWDDATHLPIAQTRISSYLCPSNYYSNDEQGRYFTAYATLTGPETLFPPDRGLTFDDITDSRSQTLLVVEACGLNIVWTEPKDIDVSRQQFGYNLPGDSPTHSPGVLSSYHKTGANVGFADGSVRYLSADIDPRVLRALTTAGGGEELDDEQIR